MRGANHSLRTVIQSKTVKFCIFLKFYGKLTGANEVFLKSTGLIAPVAPALSEPLANSRDLVSMDFRN